jgi:hypothetical protein
MLFHNRGRCPAISTSRNYPKAVTRWGISVACNLNSFRAGSYPSRTQREVGYRGWPSLYISKIAPFTASHPHSGAQAYIRSARGGFQKKEREAI